MNLSILIPWGGDVDDEWRSRSFEWVQARYRTLLPGAELIIGESEQEPFSRAEARNDAYNKSSREYLLVADADTTFMKDQITQGIDLILHGAPWVIPYAYGRYYNLSQTATEKILANTPSHDLVEPQDSEEWEHAIDSWAGLLLLHRSGWEAVGGYCEEFIGWGAEDNAFRHALDRRVGKHWRLDTWVAHLWHPRKDADFTQPFWSHNAALLDEFKRGKR